MIFTYKINDNRELEDVEGVIGYSMQKLSGLFRQQSLHKSNEQKK